MPKTTVDEDRDSSGTEDEIRPHPSGPTLGNLSADPLLSSPPSVAFAKEKHASVRDITLPLPRTTAISVLRYFGVVLAFV